MNDRIADENLDELQEEAERKLMGEDELSEEE
jgi:hypothetical protein